MTHAPEIGAIDHLNRLHILALVFGADFSYHMHLEGKILAPKINMAESDVDDEFVICN